MPSSACLGNLPIETITFILKLCDYRAILRFSVTNKEYHRVICNSSSLQLLIELESNDLEVLDKTPGISDQLTLKQLRQRLLIRRSLRHSEPPWYQSVEHRGPGTRICGYSIRDNHCFGPYDEDDIGHSDGLHYNSLSIIDLVRRGYKEPLQLKFRTRFQSFAIDLTQELVVLVENRWGTPTLARFHFRSTIDGEPHPLARHPTISIQLDNIQVESFQPDLESDGFVPNPILEIQTEVAGKLFIVGCRWVVIECHIYEVLIFDWVSGILLGRIRSETTIAATFALLDNDHLLLYSATSKNRSSYPDVIALLVYQVPCIALSGGDANGHFETAWYPCFDPILVLEFPPLRESMTFLRTVSFKLPTNPGVGQAMFHGLPSFTCSRVPIIDLQIPLYYPAQDSKDNHTLEPGQRIPRIFSYQVYVCTSHIFERLAWKVPGPTTISWNDWGPCATHWFEVKNRSPVVGSQCVQWIENGHYHKLSSIEFNPHSIETYSPPFSNSSIPSDEVSRGRRSIHNYFPRQ
ncbi:unnamed protein product [Rhizoctonia solani]|uniref:F-box domain-containing protein n=1 Tax=Rhizoctonia solani TaxID=456999 RepID=A0A8H3AKF4_9AGAM|nr:unnamed protein product [Rhizoctonia solani]CAE6514155.1 unnamed protein product [Rhizoctonia solani]